MAIEFAQVGAFQGAVDGPNVLFNPTSIQFGPDGRLYVAEQSGSIHIFEIDVQNGEYVAVSEELMVDASGAEIIRSIQNHDDDGAINDAVTDRQVTGILVAGTAENPVLYVTSSDPRINSADDGRADTNLDTNSGILSRVTWNGSDWEVVDLVRGLPRSEENHSNNGILMSEDGTKLYTAVGGNTNQGAPSTFFSYTAEYALSGALLEIDLVALDALPVLTDNSAGQNGRQYVYDLPTLDDPNTANVTGGGGEDASGMDEAGPWGGRDGLNQTILPADAPMRIYADGFRNNYDLVQTATGQMYTVDNGGNLDLGGPPVFVDGLPTNEIDNGGAGDPEPLYHVVEGGYYGHPSPVRANQTLEWVVRDDDGNPDGSLAVNTVSDISSRVPDAVNIADGYLIDPSKFTGDPARLAQSGVYVSPNDVNSESLVNIGSSSNGLVEYTGAAFDGALQGALLVAQFNGNITVLNVNADGSGLDPVIDPGEDGVLGTGDDVVLAANGVYSIATGLATPLDVIMGPGGTVWVAEIGGSAIKVFTPTDVAVDDEDADNDGILDIDDPFSRDPTNGGAVQVTPGSSLLWDFDPNQDGNLPGPSGYGGGLTGAMINGVIDYEDYYQEPADFPDQIIRLDNVKFLTAAGGGTIVVENASTGDPLGGANNGEYLFHTGVTIAPTVESFTITWTVVNPTSTMTGPDQQIGGYIGTGDQSNYLKFAATQSPFGEIVVTLEDDDLATSTFLQADSLFSAPLDSAITLELVIDPGAATATPTATWETATGTQSVSGSALSLAGTGVLDAINGDVTVNGQTTGLAVGLFTTNTGQTDANTFQAIFDGIEITATGAPVTESVLYRVNAGGELIAATDGGPDWSADTAGANSAFLASAGSNTTAGFNVTPGATVPGEVPAGIFQTERYDTPGGAAMQWAFDAPQAGFYEVRLFVGNGYEGTAEPGERVFDVSVEGAVPAGFGAIDLAGTFGDLTGAMLSTQVEVTDGVLNLEFIHGVENPLINGVEIIQLGDAVDLPAVSIMGDQSVAEAAGFVQLSFTTSATVPAGETVTVFFQIIPTTTTGEVDFTIDPSIATFDAGSGTYSGSFVFAGGSSDASIPITIVNDAAFELDETVTAVITGVSANATIGTASAVITIVDDDPEPTDVTPPTAVIAPVAEVTGANAAIVVSVTYADETALDATSIGTEDLTLSGPGLAAPLAPASVSFEPTTGVATYSFTAPTGGWTDGAFTIDLLAAQVADAAGNTAAAAQAAVTVNAAPPVDVTPPTAVIAPLAEVTSASDSIVVSVTYADETALDAATIGVEDLTLSGPGLAAPLAPGSFSFEPTTGVATYIFAAPTGGWANGAFAVDLLAAQVADTAGNTAAAAQASVTVNVAPPTGGEVLAAINAGGPALTQDGIDFSADALFAGGQEFEDIDDGNGVQPVFTGTIYETERFGDFSYSIPLTATGPLEVELHFAEIYWPDGAGDGIGSRVFDVLLEGVTAFDNVDILSATGGDINAPLVLTLTTDSSALGANGALDIALSTEVDNAKLSGIIVRGGETTPTDVTPPTAVIAPVAEVTDANAAIVVSVTYADETALDASSIGVADLTLSGPGITGALAPSSVAFEPTTGVATYSFTAPTGGWTNGALTVDLLAAQVADAAGNTAAAAQAAVTVNVAPPVDVTPPTAVIAPVAEVTDANAAIVVSVTYADETALDATTIDVSDLTLSGPGLAAPLAPASVSFEPTTGVAAYSFTAPTGGWTDGAFTVDLLAAQVADTAGNTAAAAQGSVTVNAAPPVDVTPPTAEIAPVAELTDANAAIVVSVTYADETALDATSIGTEDLTLSGPGLAAPLAPASVSFEPTTGVATYSFAAPTGSWTDGAFTVDLLAAQVADTAGNTTAAAQTAVTVNTAPPVDVTPPTAVIAPVAEVTDANAAIVVSVTYADETALDATSIGTEDLTLSGPGLAAPLAPASVSFEPTTGVATYSFTAPTGGWTNGAFTVDLLAAQVADTAGNTAAAAQAAVTVNAAPPVDETPPTAVIAPIAEVTDAAAAITVSVTYADETALDAATIGVEDLTLSGPGLAAPLAPASVSFEPTTGVATYSFTAPTGGWTNGAFTVDLLAAQVADTAGNTAAAAQTSVTVNVAPPAGGEVLAAINAGGPALSQDGVDFSADALFTGGQEFEDIDDGNGVQPVFTGTIYETERFGDFSYSIPLTATGALEVELHFAEIYWPDGAGDGIGSRVFDVLLEGATVLDNIDILGSTGGDINAPLVLTLATDSSALGANGALDIAFSTEVDNAKLSGIIVRGGETTPVDVTPPTAVIAPVAEVTDAAAAIVVSVTYADETALDATSIGTEDLTLSGPGITGALAPNSVSFEPTTGVATYSFTAPSGGWADGAFTVDLLAAQVADTAGNTAAAAQAAVTVNAAPPVDVTPPTAVIAPVAEVTDANATIVVSVTYADETALDATSIGTEDLTLSGPGLAAPLAPASVSFEPTTGVAAYSFTAPTGGWTDGAFTVDLLAAQVADTAGNTAAAAQGSVTVNAAPPVDVTPPTAVIAPVAEVTDAAAAIVVSVTYTDETALDAASIDVSDLTLSGPGLAAPLAPASVSFEPTTGVATYSFAAPSGGWADGAFTVDLLAAQVADTAGNTAAAAQAAVTVNAAPPVDVTPPTAVIAPVAEVTDAAAAIVVSVTYADETALDAASIDVSDLTLSGPGLAAPLSPASVSFEPTTGVATYSFTAPTGGWTDGAFTVDLLAAQVADTAGNTAAAAQAAVTVNAAPPVDVTPPTAVIAPIAEVTDAAAAITVSVSYADETALDATSIGTEDLTLSGPGLAAPLAPASVSFEPTTGVATYSFAAPTGGWTDGAFTVDLLAAQVADTAGNTAAAAQAAVTVNAAPPVDVTPPTAVIAPVAEVTDAAAAIVVSVTYTDETALDAASIDVSDLTLSGPGLAAPLAPASVSFEPTTGVATYSFTAPTGGWTDGAFTVDLLAAQVADTAGNTAAAAQAAVTVNAAPVPTTEAETILFGLSDVDSGATYEPTAVGSAVLTVLQGVENVEESNFLQNSFSITNTGDKQIAAVFVDVRDAVFNDAVFDIDGSAGDDLTKAFVVETDGGTGGFFVAGVGGTYFLEGAAPLANTTGTGMASTGGHRGLLIRFSGAEGGFANGETVSFSGDMDPNSVAGLLKSDIDTGALDLWDVGGISGLELAGSSFTVLFDDGSTAEGVLHAEGTQAGGVGEAVQDRAVSTATVTVNGFAAGEAGTYGSTAPEIVVSGTPGETVRVVLAKSFNPVVNNTSGIADLVRARLADTHPGFEANNAFDVQTVDVVIGPSGSTTLLPEVFDYNTASSGNDFPAAVVDSAGGAITLPSSQTSPIVVAAAVIDASSGFALGPVDRVYLSNPTATPVGATEPETVPGAPDTPPEGNELPATAGASVFLFSAPVEEGSVEEEPVETAPLDIPPGALVGTEEPDTSFGESDADDVIYALDGDDVIDALGGADIVHAGDGADTVSGGAGADQLFGERGDDTLDGGAGDDSLDGGAGLDVFVFREGFGSDTITGFEHGVDLIEIHASSFVDGAAAAAAVTQDGANAVLEVAPGDVILFLADVSGAFTEDDFSIL